MLDMYGVGLAVYPFNYAQLLVQQEAMAMQQEQADSANIDMDNLGDFFDLDSSEEIIDMQFEDLDSSDVVADQTAEASQEL